MSAPSGRGSWCRRFPALWLCALLFVLTIGVAPPAQAAGTLDVTLKAVSVSGGAPTATLTITGTAVNHTAGPLYDAKALLWRSTDRLRTLSAVENALVSEPPSGREVSDQPGEVAALTAPGAALLPGTPADFTVTAKLEDLDLSADASYVVGADAIAATAPGAEPGVVGRGRSLATVPGDTPPEVVNLIELASKPRRLRPDLFADDTLAAELSGRLKVLLDGVKATGATWIVDPSLVAEATDMADGYRVVDGAGSKAGTGQAAAAAWLTEFATLPRATGYLTLYGHPDLVGATADGSATVLDRALEASKGSGLDLPVVAVVSRVSEPALRAAAARRLPVIATGVGSAKAWVSMGGAGVAGALRPDAPVNAQPLGGDSALTESATLLAVARATERQVRLIDNEAALARDAEATPGWVRRSTLSLLLVDDPKTVVDAPTPPDAPGGLTRSLVGRLDRLARDVDAYGSAARSSGLAALAAPLASNAASEAWLSDPQGRLAYLSQLEQRTGAAALAKGIVLTAPPRVTLASDRSPFPATIGVASTIPDPIRVRVVGVSDNSVRVSVRSSDWVTVRPGESQTVQLTATASANGIVPVTLYVETQDAKRVSADVVTSVEATNLGMVGWIIVGVSGVVLVVTTALRIRQVRRRRSA